MSFSTRCLFLVSNCRFCFSQGFLNLISNSSSLAKRNHDRDGVWISDLNQRRFYDFISPFTPQFQFQLRRYIKLSRQCLTTFPNTSKFVKNTLQCVMFSTLFLAFEKLFNNISFTNRPYSYSQNWNETSLQLRLTWESFQMQMTLNLFLMIFSCVSLYYKLVQVQYQV